MSLQDARSLDDVRALDGRNGSRHTHSTRGLSDVSKETPTDDDLWVYDAGTGMWGPRSLALGDLSDVTITTPINKQVLTYNSGSAIWVNETWPPTGVIFPYAGTTAPTGFLLCDGSAVSRSTFSVLFALISTTFGAGDGSTTFNVPDLRGRVPVALDNLGGSDAGRLAAANTLGGSGGTETHTLTSSEMPTHLHNAAQTSTDNTNTTRGGSFMANNSGTDTTHANQGGNATTNAGSGGAHNNMQPYLLVGYIIKY